MWLDTIYDCIMERPWRMGSYGSHRRPWWHHMIHEHSFSLLIIGLSTYYFKYWSSLKWYSGHHFLVTSICWWFWTHHGLDGCIGKLDGGCVNFVWWVIMQWVHCNMLLGSEVWKQARLEGCSFWHGSQAPWSPRECKLLNCMFIQI